MENNFLFTIPYKDLVSWSYGLLLHLDDDKFRYPTERLGKFLKKYENKAVLMPEKIFTRITIKTKGQGVVKRDEILGQEIKTQGQFYVRAGQFIYSNIDARNGAFGIVPQELDMAIITNSFTSFDCDKTRLLPGFLVLLLSTPYYVSIFEKISVGTTNRRSVKPDALFNIKIPVPPIEKQKEILLKYCESQREISILSDLTNYDALDDYLISDLTLEYINTFKNSDKKLSFINYQYLGSWDIKNRANNDLLFSNKCSNVPLSRVAQINPKTEINLKDDDIVSFIPMECVSDKDGEVMEYRTIKKSTKGYTKFKNGDIIWAKITPCMQNGKSAIVDKMINGIGYGSTEFHVIRVNNQYALTEYIYYLLRMVKVRKEATQYFTGSAGQQRVNENYLKNLNIPLPSKDKQQEIVDYLNEHKAFIKKNRIEMEKLQIKAKQDFENEIFNK